MAKRKSAATIVRSSPAGPPRWMIATYDPVSLFSLRSTYSMSKGGKTLLVPTPYAVKMALIDAAFRATVAESAAAAARKIFDDIKDSRIRLRPPQECVVQNTFVKIRQEERGAEAGQYVPTIAYREMVFLSGSLAIAMDASRWDDVACAQIRQLAAHINYFGKRGSFFQFLGTEIVPELPSGFSIAAGDAVESMPLGQYGVTQYLDDFGPDLCRDKTGFDRISTYHDNPMTIEKHRILVSTLLPYRRLEATRSFTRYTTRPVKEP